MWGMTADDHRAFNQGADARLRGEPQSGNPYRWHGTAAQMRLWYQGWRDTDRWWGHLVRGRWGCEPLPPVKVGSA